jgi:hypothetical protein
MAHTPNPLRRTKSRRLKIEGLQSREMMAADFGVETSSAASLATSSSAIVLSADPGSTLRSAYDLGDVEDSVLTRNSVNFSDRVDLYRFDISRNGSVDLDLTGLTRNVDLVFADESGRVIEASRSAGRASEEISVDLESGTYFVGVQTRSFWGSRYQLSLDVQLDEPTPVNGGSDPLSPLSEVEYFGGSREWNINAVNAPEAWAAGFSGDGITIAVVDTGVDLDHPDLVNNLYVNTGEIRGNGIDDDGNGYVDDVHGYDFAARDADPNDVGGHGTHVAGTIAAGLNGFGATGVAPDATILPVRVLGNNGSGSTNAVASGIRYAAEQGADIINLSLGGGFSRAIQSAIDYAQDLGSFIVAAAGNEGASTPGFPARFSAIYDNVLSVGAHNSSTRVAGFSNDVGGSGAVQIDAPGVGVFSTYVGGRYANLSGTSMAAPNVAGVAALALSANPDLTPSELRSLLVGGTTTAAVGSDALGIVNAATTVAYAAAGLTAPPLESPVSVAITASGNARTYRAISFSGEIVAESSDFLASDETATESNFVDVETPSIENTVNRKQSSYLVSSNQQVVSNDLIDIIVDDHEPEPKAVDAVFGDDFIV